jgi:hypothetical protein
VDGGSAGHFENPEELSEATGFLGFPQILIEISQK